MKNYVESQFNQIKNLPLFAKISEDELHKILKNAHIKNCKKNEILFSKDDKILSFYIVLSGAAKLLISNEEGQEAILQIAKLGDFIGDLFSKTFIADAQIIENSLILAIPAEKFQESLQQNLQFAVNILKEISAKNRSFINQAAYLKIGTAQQKVGQLLLKSAFKKEGKKGEEINLDCDKKTIASYLGIRSETFSRILKKLENEGEITIKKNKMILLKENSLCNYCDGEISAECDKHKSSTCLQNHSSSATLSKNFH